MYIRIQDAKLIIMSKAIAKTLTAVVVTLVAFSFAIMPAAAQFNASQSTALQAAGFSAAEIAALQAILGGGSSTSTGGDVVTTTQSTGYTHTVTLRLGSRGTQVSALQSALNSCYQAGLVADGAYGPATKAAVMSAQSKLGVTVDGIVGPATGGMLGTCTVTSVVTTPGETGTETGSGNTNQFVLAGGDEATLSNFDLDDTGTDPQEGETEEVAEITFDVEDADVLLERADIILQFTGTDDGDDTDPEDVFDSIRLIVNGEEVAELDGSDYDEDDYLVGTPSGSSYTFTSSDEYRYRFSGLAEVLEEGEEATIMIEVEVSGSVDLGTDNSSQWEVFVEAEGLRMVDGAGLTQEIPSTDQGGATFDIEEEGQEDELTVSASSDDPDATVLEVDDDNASDTHTVFVFEIEADEDSSDLMINDFELDVTLDAIVGSIDETGLTFAEVIDDIWLEVDGQTEDGEMTTSNTIAADGGAATNTYYFDFDSDPIELDSGDDMDVELHVKFKGRGSNYDEGMTIQAMVTSSNVDAWDVEGADDLGAGQLNGSATGDAHQLFENGINVELASSSYTETVNDSGQVTKVTYTMNYEVSAFGDTFYVPFGATRDGAVATTGFNFQIEDGSNNVVTSASSDATTSVAASSNADVSGNYWRVDDGDTETVTVTVSVTNDGTLDTYVPGFIRVQGLEMRYDTDTAGAPAAFSLSPAQDFETSLREIDA